MTIKKKTCLVITLLLFLALFSVLASAQIIPKEKNVVIQGEGSLLGLLQYSEQNYEDRNLTEPILVKEGEICYLYQPLHIAPQSTFRFEGKDCPELRMYPGTYIRITGTAYFLDIKVTSADKITKQPININRQTYNHPRPHIYTDEPADYVEIKNSEFSYLGSYTAVEGSTWGVSFWHLKSGHVTDSEFHHNYFGLYTWDSKDVTIENSTFHDNLEYGLDFHDYSDNFMVRNNTVYNNGNHGIIFSKYCVNNQVINNYVYDHTQPVFVKGHAHDYGIHGIMLHHESNGNTITGNILKNNDRGIFIYRSHDNVIEDNIILSDRKDGIYIDHSLNNILRNNIVLNTSGYGLYSYYSQDNEYSENYFENGTYFKDEVDEKEAAVFSDKKYFPYSSLSVDRLRLNAGKNELSQEELAEVISANSNNVIGTEQGIFGNLRIPTLAEFINYKISHILAISMVALVIFGIEMIYKRNQKRKKEKIRKE